MRHVDSSSRLSSYASMAAVAAAGVGTAANADLLIFDVGLTYTASLPEGSSGSYAIPRLNAALRLDALDTTMFLGAYQLQVNNGSGTFFSLTAWGASFDGSRGGVAANKTSKAINYQPGDSVSGMTFASGAAAGKDKSKNIPLDSSTKATALEKGVLEGQTYLGFKVDADEEGFGFVPRNYGWVDVTVGLDDEDNFFLTINRWAYETEANVAASIPAGAPVPGVGGLLALAMGAAGVRRRRERVA